MKKVLKLTHHAYFHLKFDLKMRLTTLFLIVSLFQLQANESYAQKTKVTLTLENVSIESVLNEIESLTDFKFIYKSSEIDYQKVVSIKAKKERISIILKKIFDGSNTVFKIVDKQIILKKEYVIDPPLPDLNLELKPNKNQGYNVKGVITDVTGQPLPGANIIEKGTTNGTQTDFDGNFSLNVSSQNAILQVSYLGYTTEEITVGSQTSFNIALKEDSATLDEVVVIGYGSRKKKDLTGAVGNVGAEAIGYKPVTQVSQALAGEVSGVTVQAASGAPGRNAATINIRGLGTFSGAGNNPLVLVDGVPSTLDNLDPNNIESISVLKDASSAAIYGSRAANGVLLVTTKRGKKGKMIVTYNGYTGFQQPTQFPDFVGSAEYAELQNEYVINGGGGAVWTDEQIELFRSGADPDNFPDVDRYRNIFESGSGFQMAHNVGFSGGSSKNTYNFSIGYLRQDGLVEQNSFDRYNFLLNIDNKMSEKLDLSVSLQGDLGTIDEPATAGAGVGGNGLSGILTSAIRLPGNVAGIRTDGTYGGNATFHPEADLASDSFQEIITHHFLGSTKLTWKPVKGLSVTGRVGYNMNHINNTLYNATFELFGPIELGPSTLQTSQTFNSELIIDLFAEYKKSFKDHNMSILVGYNQDAYMTENLTGYRDDFPTNTLFRLNAGSAANQQNSGSASEWALQSYFGRFQYDFKGKYLLDLSARYDGSSRFPEDNRWGYFPSIGVGWRISEENFMSTVTAIDNLKLRASWGKLGNQQIGNYPYQSVLTLGQDYPFGVGDNLASGAAPLVLANSEVAWETTTGTDIGLEMTLFKGKFDFVIDYFDKTTTDILYSISTSETLGLNPSEVNAGAVSNKGWDFELGYNNNLGNFTYGINLNFSTVQNQVEKLADLEEDIANGLFVGESLNSVYGYISDGLFVDQADIDSYPTQPLNAEPGFVRFKDISGPDGVPDGVVDAVYDRKVIGSRFPKYTFGGNITMAYKGFDLLAQFAGAAGMNRNLASLQVQRAFQNDVAPQRWQVDGRWTVENPDPNATYPKFSLNAINASTITSDFFLINASYVRLKNLVIGYSLPKSILDKVNMSQLRFYVSGSNLLTLDDFYEGWDPEPQNPGANTFYPFTSVYSLGINAKF